MTAPNTVCSGLDFSITVHSDTRIWVQLDISNDNGSTWISGNTNSLTTFNGTEWVKSIPDNINASRRYRITYSISSFFLITNTYEKPGGLAVTLYPTPVIANIPSTTICGGNAFSVIPQDGNGNTVPSGTTYTWTVPSNTNITGESNQNVGQSTIGQVLTNTTSSTQSVTYTVVPTSSNGCAGDPFTLPVLVNPVPQINTITAPAICSDATLSFTPTNGTDGIVPDGTTYTWTVDANANVTGMSNQSSPQSSIGLAQTLRNNTTTQKTVVYHVTPISTNGCSGPTFTLNVPVNPKPYINDKSYPLCSGNAFNVNFGGADKIPVGTTYAWIVAPNTNVTGQSDQTGQTSISQTLTTSSTSQQTVIYTVTPTSLEGCTGPTFQVTITITPTPIITTKYPVVCSGGGFTLQPLNGRDGDIVPPGTAYTWTFAPNTNVTGQTNQPVGQLAISQSLVNLTNVDQHVIYTVTSTTANGCAATTFQIDATVVPMAIISGKSKEICSNNIFSVIPVNGNGDIVLAGTTYTWTVIDNPNVSGDIDQSTPQLSISQMLINNTIAPQTVLYTATSNTNSGCASTSFSVTIIVDPTPQIVSKTPAAICSGQTFSVNPQNGVGGDIVPSGTTYTWVVSSNSNVTGQSNQSSQQSLISQTLVNLTDVVQTLTYTVTPKAAANECVGSDFTITVVINPKPTILDKTPAAICSGSSFLINPATGSGEIVPAGTTYSWVVSNNANVSGQSNLNGQTSIGQTLRNLTNVDQVLTYTVTPTSSLGCTGNSFIVTVTIKPVSTIIDKTITICSEQSFNGTPSNATDIIPLGTTYTWTKTNNANILGASNQTAQQGTISQLLTNISSATQSVTYTVLPSLLNACAPSQFNIVVIVNPKPAIANITAAAICSGTSFSVVPTDGTDLVPVGTTYTWTVAPNTFITGQSDVAVGQSTIGQILNNLTNINKLLVYTVTPTSAAGCVGANFQVTVVVKPTAIIATKTQTICSETAFVFSPANDGVDVIPSGTLYKWVLVPNANITGGSSQLTAQLNISQTLTNLTNIPQDLIYIVTPVLGNGCSTGNFTATVTVNPKPTIANINTTVCSVTPFTVTPTNGSDIVPAGTVYTWIVGNNSNLSGQSDQNLPQTNISQTLVNATSITQPLYYTVHPTSSAGCVGPQFTIRVDVKATPNIASASRTICSGSSFTVLPTNVGNIVPAGTTYTWNVVANPKVTGNADQSTGLDRVSQVLNNISNVNQSIVYNVTATTLESCASTFVVDVTVKPTSVIANKVATICSNNTFTISPVNGTDIVPAGTKYTWIVVPNANLSGLTNQTTASNVISQSLINNTNQVQTATYSVSSILNNGCTGGDFTSLVTVNPLPIVTINTTATAVCAGDAVTLTGVGAQNYVWNQSVLNATSFIPSSTLSYTVTGTDANGCVNSATQFVVVNPHPVVTVTNNILARCGTGNLTLTASTDIGTIKWYDALTAGTLVGSGNNLNIPSISNSQSYFVDALSVEGCYAIGRKKVDVVVKDIPNITSVVNNLNCGPGNVIVKARPSAGVVNWYLDSVGGSSLKTDTSYTTPIINKTVIYFVDATFNNCTTLKRVPVIATIDTIPIITSINPLPVCYPNLQDLTATSNTVVSNSSVTYSYWYDLSATSSIANPSRISNSGTYYIKVTDLYNCSSISAVDVVIHLLPPSPIVKDLVYCQKDTSFPLTAIALPNHSIKWYQMNPAGGVGSNIAPIPSTDSVGGFKYYVSQVNNTTTCESPRGSIQVTVLDLPIVTVSSSSNPICYGGVITLTGAGANTYIWDKAVINNQPFPVFTSDRYSVIGIDSNGCKNTSFIDQLVNPLPVVSPLRQPLAACEGGVLNLLNNVSVGQPPYQYFIYSNSLSIVGDSFGNLKAIKAGNANVYFKVKDANGCISDSSITFKINVYAPMKSQTFFQEAFYDDYYTIKTKIDSGYTAYNWYPAVNLNFYDIQNPIFKGINDQSYFVDRIDTTSKCKVTDIYNITITTNFIFDLPNAFTPNGDGLNDIIKAIPNAGISSLNYLKIFNRKGNLVYQTANLYEGWDGRVNGIEQEPDAFYWIAEYITKKNETIRKSGSFLLIK
jgi:gliding motility-associated-like protein